MENIFNVLTEFRFDAGRAILESDKLKNAVDGIATAANNTSLAFQSLGAGIVGHIDILHGGIISGLLKAIEVSDKFNLSASGFANIIQANMKNMQGDIGTFNDRLQVSKQILMDIHRVSATFGLDENAMLETTKGLGAVLAPMHQAGTNFSTAIDMARMSMKAAPTLGVQPQFMQQEMVNILTGKANQQDTLFRRLLSDTETMKPFSQSGGQGFNALPPAKKVEVLNRALNEFSRDTEVAEFNMRSLHNQLMLLQNAFTGFASILKPIGDLLLPIIQKALMQVNRFLEHSGRKIIENLTETIEPFFRDPRRTMAGVMGLQKLPEDIGKTKHIMKMFGELKTLEWVLGLVGVKLHLFSKVLEKTGDALFPGHKAEGLLKDMGKTVMGEGPGMGVLAKGLGAAAFEIVESMSKVLVIFQIFSKGFAYAKIDDIEFLAKHTEVMSSIIKKFGLGMQKLFLPITNGIDALARFIGWLFSFGFFTNLLLNGLDNLGTVFEFIADLVTEMSAVFAALGNVVSYLIANIMELNFSGISKAGISDAFFGGFKQFLNENLLTKELRGANGLSTEKNVGKTVTNIGKVEMRLDFKENMQPDRVAFTIVEQLRKVGQNPTQGNGNTHATSALNGGR